MAQKGQQALGKPGATLETLDPTVADPSRQAGHSLRSHTVYPSTCLIWVMGTIFQTPAQF